MFWVGSSIFDETNFIFSIVLAPAHLWTERQLSLFRRVMLSSWILTTGANRQQFNFLKFFPNSKSNIHRKFENYVVCPYSSICSGGPLLTGDLICRWCPFFSISALFVRTVSSWGHRGLFGLHTGQVESTGELASQEQPSTVGVRVAG